MLEPEEITFAKWRLGNHVPGARNTCPAMEKLSEAVLSTRFALQGRHVETETRNCYAGKNQH
jgi:hypothetical protein